MYLGLTLQLKVALTMVLLLCQVVGGMTWCITTCSFDIDVDLLFQENSTIGQKM